MSRQDQIRWRLSSFRFSLIHSIYAFHIFLHRIHAWLPGFLQGHGRIPTGTSTESFEHCSRDHCLRRCVITLGGTLEMQSIICYWRLLDHYQPNSVFLAWLHAVNYVGVSISRLLRSLTDNHLVVSNGGLGRPISSLTPSETSTFLRILMATMITYSLTITSVKMSLLLLYRRIFNTRLFKMQSLIVGIACIAWLVVEMSLNIFQCVPFTAAFQPAYLFTDHCIDLQAFYWGVTVTNLGLDVVVLLLPMQVVWQLKLPKRQKIILSGIFLLGGL